MDSLYLQQNIWDGIIPNVILLYGSLTMYRIQANLSADSCKQEYHPQCLNKFSIGKEQ